jgi:HlyD family secretion protein
VVQIRQAPINIQNVITYNVVITVPNPDLKLFPGMTANVKIHVDKHDSILKIPNAALRFRPPDLKEHPVPGSDGAPGIRGNRDTVGPQTIWALGDDGKPRPVTVKLGITDGGFSEAIEGDLQEGQEVVVGVRSSKGSSAGEQTRPFGLR